MIDVCCALHVCWFNICIIHYCLMCEVTLAMEEIVHLDDLSASQDTHTCNATVDAKMDVDVVLPATSIATPSIA